MQKQVKQTLQIDKEQSKPRMTKSQLRNEYLCNQIAENREAGELFHNISTKNTLLNMINKVILMYSF